MTDAAPHASMTPSEAVRRRIYEAERVDEVVDDRITEGIKTGEFVAIDFRTAVKRQSQRRWGWRCDRLTNS